MKERMKAIVKYRQRLYTRRKSAFLFLIISLLALIGTINLVRQRHVLIQHAATVDSVRVEAELGTSSGPVTVGNDQAASGGMYATLNATGGTASSSALAPMPLISRNVSAFTNDDCHGSYPAGRANDSSYDTTWWGCNTPSTSNPSWLAYDLSSVPIAQRKQVLVVWYNRGTGAYDHLLNSTQPYNNIRDYTIDVNAAPGGTSAPITGWVTKASITGNTYHSRDAVFDMTGYNWVRLNVTAPDGSSGNDGLSVNMDVHDASLGTDDGWMFYGASIFQDAMNVDSRGGVPAFQQLITASASAYYPQAQDGSVGGFLSSDGVANLPTWLPLFHGKYVGLGYGTNDALGCTDPTTFYNNYVTLIQDVLHAGKIPVVQKILWGQNASIQRCAPGLNAQIDQLYKNYPQVIPGPDTWTYFQAHPELIGSDGIHPTDAGDGALRQLWANTAFSAVYAQQVRLAQNTNHLAYSPATNKKSVLAATTALPGQQIWQNGVSSLLFGSNDTEEWGEDNVETDPHNRIQSAMKNAHMQLERVFLFHYSLRDGHRTSIGPAADAKIQLHPSNAHEYDQPVPPSGLYTPSANSGYEIENRLATVEKMGMTPLCVLKDITTDATSNADPDTMHHRITDPDTGQLETDLDFAKKVVAYLGNRCNLYEIGNEPDLDGYEDNGYVSKHFDIKTYVERWTEFVTELRKINPNAKFIGPVTYSEQGNDCTYTAGTPYPSSQPGDCYLANFLHGVKGTVVEPDAVSFHFYGDDNCGTDTPGAQCLSNEPALYGNAILKVRQWIQNDLGHMVPVGITEWNANPDDPKYMVTDPTLASQWTTAIMQAMIQSGLDFANQFDTQSDGGYCYLDMFTSCDGSDNPTGMFTAMQTLIRQYLPTGTTEAAPTSLASELFPSSGTTPTPTLVPCTTIPPTGTGVVTIGNVTFPSSGNYMLFTRMQVPQIGNGYYVQIDTGCPLQITDTRESNTWDWVTTATPFSATAGTTHTVTLYGKDQNVNIDEVLFSQTCTPTGVGDNCLGPLPTETPTPTLTPLPPTPTVRPTASPTPLVTATLTPTPTSGQAGGTGSLIPNGSAHAQGTFSGAGVKITLPATIHAGALLVVAAGTNGPAGTWTTPAGWTPGNGSATVNSAGLSWWWKIAGGNEAGTKIILKSSKYVDGGAVAVVYDGADATPISGVSSLQVNDNHGVGHVTNAIVSGVTLSGATTIVPLILAGWQPNASTILWPSGILSDAVATDGYAYVTIGHGSAAQTTNTLASQLLTFGTNQAVIQTLQIAVRVH